MKRKEEFLELFPISNKSGITNRFLEIIRAGEDDPYSVVSGVIDKIESKFERTQAEEVYLSRIVMYYDLAVKFASYYIDYEKLSPTEKNKLKNESSSKYLEDYKSKTPATDKQKQFIKSLGYVGEVSTMKEASDIIDRLKVNKS